MPITWKIQLRQRKNNKSAFLKWPESLVKNLELTCSAENRHVIHVKCKICKKNVQKIKQFYGEKILDDAINNGENTVFFNPDTPSRITPSKISKSLQARCLRVQSSFMFFPVHQPAAANSMHLKTTYTSHLKHLSN